ncbi:hypothetical protein DICA3_D05050 [Diutina catenulata]
MTRKLVLYSFPTPNGFRVSTYLHALGLEYEWIQVNILKGESKSPEFVKLNPNGRIPTLVDRSTGVTISQTGAILMYLADTYEKDRKWSYAPGTPEYWRQIEILIFSQGEQGPIQGQANHFMIYSTEKVPYAIERYSTDVKRIYGVLNDYLKLNELNGPYFVGTHYSPADFEIWAWARSLERLGIDLSEWPLVRGWFDKFASVKEVQAGLEHQVE